MSKISEEKDGGWLIHKAGRGWYRPNAEGYTNDTEQAGRYSHADARSHSHPNGWDGPRDGITIKHESELRSGGEEKNGVGVKPLEWREEFLGTWWTAEAYRIETADVGGFSARVAHPQSKAFRTILHGVSLEDAKAAAQADYELRILSALTNTDLSLRAENERLRKELNEATAEIERRDLSFDLRWNSDMRAIERWQKATGRTMTLPDHTDLSVWLFAQLEAAEAKREEAAKVLEPFVAYIKARDDSDPDMPDDAPAVSYSAELRGPVVAATIGDFRAARTFLANLKVAE